jgi:hypothetical protein
MRRTAFFALLGCLGSLAMDSGTTQLEFEVSPTPEVEMHPGQTIGMHLRVIRPDGRFKRTVNRIELGNEVSVKAVGELFSEFEGSQLSLSLAPRENL